MHPLALLILTTQTEEGVVLALGVEADHDGRLLVGTEGRDELADRLLIHVIIGAAQSNGSNWNKMNKTSTSRSSVRSRPAVPMRLMFKRRSNFKEAAQPVPTEGSQQDNMSSMRDYVRTRLQTEEWPRASEVTPQRSTVYSIARSQTETSLSLPSATPKRERDQKIEQGLRMDQEEPTKKAPTLKQIQEQLDEVLEGRLVQCLSFRGKSDWMLAPQVDALIGQVRKARELDDPQLAQSDLHEVQKRIKMIEKLLAQNMTESEIAKKYYLSRVSHAQGQSGHKRNNTEPIVSEAVDRKAEKELPKKAVVKESNSHQAYHKPSNEAYKLDRLEVKYVDLGKVRQPLPRSNYKREFLHYSPVRNIANRPKDHSLPQSNSAMLCQSSYRSEFVAKRSDRVNHKELDACRDKIKDLPIIFGRQQKEEITRNMVGFFKARKEEQKHNPRDSQSVASSTLHPTNRGQYARYFQSESRRAYGGQLTVAPTIKHKQMERLKMQYRSRAHV